MFSFWVFAYIAVIGVIPIAIGMIPVAESNDAPMITRFARWYANHKWPMLVWYVLLTVVPLGATVLWNYMHPSISAQAIIDRTSAHDYEHRFTWVSNSSLGGMIPWLTQMRKSSGLMWEGYTMGVSRESGEVGGFVLWIYGSDEGVGHYVWRGGADRFRREYGEGHVPMMIYLYDVGKGMRRELDVLQHAATKASATINQYYRPLEIYDDKKTGTMDIYDPESGRNVYLIPGENSNSNAFVFGPHPMANGPYMKMPGLQISEGSSSEPMNQLIFRVQDVYGKPLNHAKISITSESGYTYEQSISNKPSDVVITVPLKLPRVQIEISRGGYHTLAADVALNQSAQRVDVILEPILKR